MDFRIEAKNAVQRAKKELISDDDSRAKYAALELRMSLECLIYDISKSYREELSETDFNIWQPKKLLEALIEIDPSVEKISEWSIGKQHKKGELSCTMNTLGIDRRLSLKEIKKFYDRFGNYLHTPTIKQLEELKAHNYSKLYDSCQELIQILDEVISSAVYNTRMKTISKFRCVKCGSQIVRNILTGQPELTAKCQKCGACYTVKLEPNRKVNWEPQLFEYKCGNSSCSEIVELFEIETEKGNSWVCRSCGGRNTICLGVAYEKPTGYNKN